MALQSQAGDIIPQAKTVSGDGFGFEPEVTIKLAQRQVRIYETPISYRGRTYAEGRRLGEATRCWRC